MEHEVLRSTAEQGLTVEVADDATLNHLARVLAQDKAAASKALMRVEGASRGA